jgi:hypothetical protein
MTISPYKDQARKIAAQDGSNKFFFEPRTGIVKREPIRSNFYVYRLEQKYLAKVELAVENDSSLHDIGLVYPQEFMQWLDSVDTKWDQKLGLKTPFEDRGVSEEEKEDQDIYRARHDLPRIERK